MVDLAAVPLFADHRTTLKKTSADKSSGKAVYMTDSEETVVDFDQVKDAYVSGLPAHPSENPQSVDALFSDREGSLVFVEFKNGKMEPKTQYGVLKKAYDSILVFDDVTGLQLKDLRQGAEFVLVYNDAKNQQTQDEELARKRIAKHVFDLAHTEYICFGLRKLKGYCFRNVHTYTKEEFAQYLSTHI